MTWILPRPVQVVIDDVGWRRGEDGHERGEPFRTGFVRDHVPADYAAIAELGRRTGTRPVAAFMLAEWDRANVLRRVPTATWMGADWDQAPYDGPWLDEAADILRREGAHLELALHGLGHEYWPREGPARDSFTRAEWFGPDGAMRPADEVRRHLDAWYHIWDSHRLAPAPRLFVPCAFRYRAGLRAAGMAPLLAERGVRAVNTPFKVLLHEGPAPEPPFFSDNGILMVDRSQNDIPWRHVGPPEGYTVSGPTLGLHWPQLLHADPARNEESVEGWVRLLQRAGEDPALMLAPDNDRFQDQLLHRAFTRLTEERGGALTLDARAFFRQPGVSRSTTVYLKRGSLLRPVPLTSSTPVLHL